jgi:hypothetical protein
MISIVARCWGGLKPLLAMCQDIVSTPGPQFDGNVIKDDWLDEANPVIQLRQVYRMSWTRTVELDKGCFIMYNFEVKLK